MKNFYTVLFVLFTFTLIAQKTTVTGFVTEAGNKTPIPGVLVSVNGKAVVQTGMQGEYKIVVNGPANTLEFSMIGFIKETREIKAKKSELITVNVKMTGSSETINTVVISSSQYEKDLKRENVSIEVLGKEQIKNTNAVDLSDAVNRVSGVQVQDGQINIRGGSSYSYGVGSRTAVMVDNMSIASGDLGMNQWTLAPLENAEQVEVIKGSSSVVYGSSALNGVVNVRTAWPSADPQTEIVTFSGVYDNPDRAYRAWWDGATRPGFTGINFTHRQKFGNVDFVGSGNLFNLNNYLENADAFRMRGNIKTRVTSNKIEGLQYGIDAGIQREVNGFFFLSVDLDTNAYLMSEGSGNRYLQTNINPHVTYTGAKGSKYILRTQYLNVYRYGNGSDPNASSNSFMADLQYQKRFKNNKAVLTAGLPGSFGFSRSNLFAGTRISYSGAAFIQGDYNVTSKLSLTAGVRYEINSVDTIVQTSIPVFRSGLNWQVAKATFLRASFGQSYRLPTIGERFVDADFSVLKIVPNPLLDVERGWSAEVGVKQGFRIGNLKALADASFFWQEYQNFVEYRFGFYNFKTPLGVDTAGFGLRPFNVAGARVAGLEFTLLGEGNIGPVNIRGMGGYTYMYPADLDSVSRQRDVGTYMNNFFKYMGQRVDSTFAESSLLQFRNRHLLRGDIELTYKKFSIGGTVYYASFPEKIPAIFTIIDTFLGYDFNSYAKEHINGDWIADARISFKVNDKIRLSAMAKNLTNHFYATRPGVVEPPRNYTLQLRIVF